MLVTIIMFLITGFLWLLIPCLFNDLRGILPIMCGIIGVILIVMGIYFWWSY